MLNLMRVLLAPYLVKGAKGKGGKGHKGKGHRAKGIRKQRTITTLRTTPAK